MGRTVAELLSSLSSSELTEWMAYYRIDPFGEQRADLRNGMLCAITANHSMSPPRSPRLPNEFMPYSERPVIEAVLLDDPAEQAKLIKSRIFGVKK